MGEVRGCVHTGSLSSLSMSIARFLRLPPYDGSEAILLTVAESLPERDSTPDILSAPSIRSAALISNVSASLSMAILSFDPIRDLLATM